MRVALLVTDLERGGAPLRLARLARGLREIGVDVHVGCLAPLGPVGRQLRGEGFATFACDARSARDFDALRRLIRALRRIRPHVLHATLTHANVAARLAGLYLRIPVLTSTATIEVERGWHVWAERLTAWADRGHVVNSAALRDHVRRQFWLPAAHVFLIPPLPAFRAAAPALSADAAAAPPRAAARAAFGIAPHEFVIAWAGRLDPVKCVPLLIECAEILSREPLRLLIAGDGPDRPAVERAIRTSSTARNVMLLGWVDDPSPVYAAADLFVFPSLTEGMPNALLEALAAGVPAVCADIPALRELADGGRRAVLVADHTPHAFAAAVAALRADPQRRAALAEAGAAWARAQFDPAAAVRATYAVYRRAALRARSAGAAARSSH